MPDETPIPLTGDSKKLTAEEKALFQKGLANPLFFPKEFKTWLNDYLAVNIPLIPISQISGFTQFVFNPAPTIVTQEATSSSTFGDLATVGPVLSALPDGNYAIFFGAQMLAGTGQAIMSVQVNSTTADEGDSAQTGGNNMTIGRIILKTLTSSNNNSLTCKYRAGAGTSNFLRRFMIVIKYSNI